MPNNGFKFTKKVSLNLTLTNCDRMLKEKVKSNNNFKDVIDCNYVQRKQVFSFTSSATVTGNLPNKHKTC